ncbi:MAG: hypothetical protein COY40_02990 [Alphaproteobacteria bacterium CG_4_10_14_0_8_um_filter_53_9]|nr:MAG: hypothetical protein COY40_02990 [Alphaproteobacteria bacterium CG_4_10_14_0_8_um_filter_53_9]
MTGFDLSLYLAVLTCVLLAGVAGFLGLLAVQVRAMRKEAAKAPVLQDSLARFLVDAKQGVEELKTTFAAVGPRVETLNTEAGKRATELTMLLSKAEKVAVRLEQAFEARKVVDAAHTLKDTVRAQDDVMKANSEAARRPGEENRPVAHDPLEVLLDGLREAREGVASVLVERGQENLMMEMPEASALKGADVVTLHPSPTKTKPMSKTEAALRGKLGRKVG